MSKVTGKECRFVVRLPDHVSQGQDYHLIKEQVHHDDGSVTPNLHIVKNFKRPFWVTKEGHRNHKEKKESENVDNLIEFSSTESELAFNVSKALKTFSSKPNIQKLSDNPYLYGTDISSSSIIKHIYGERYNVSPTPYTYCTLDIETDVIGDLDILMITISNKTNIYTVINKEFVKGFSDPLSDIRRLSKVYLKDILEKGIVSDVIIAEDAMDVVVKTFEKIHEWQPDFLSIWNMNFDIRRIIETCDKNGVHPEDIFSDPTIPQHFRFFRYKEGRSKKVTSSGKVMSVPPAAQWHTVFSPSSFYVIDAMCSYKHIRLGQPEEQSYKLDAILNKELKKGKLKVPGTEELTGILFHQVMQRDKKIEYIVYNIFDAYDMVELEEKTKDISISLPLFSGDSEFSSFEYQPKRASDALHFFFLENGRVIASMGKNAKSEDDDEFEADLSGWIITLPAYLTESNGEALIQEGSMVNNNIRRYVADLDISAAYPSGQICYNMSKETTHSELVSVEGISEEVYRAQNINLSSGSVNAIEYCTFMFGFPDVDDIINLI